MELGGLSGVKDFSGKVRPADRGGGCGMSGREVSGADK